MPTPSSSERHCKVHPLRSAFSFLFSYETVRILSVNSISIGLLHRALQFVVLFYIIGYVLVYNRGYQEFKEGNSVVSTKVKGIFLANYSKEEFQIHESLTHLYNRLWDSNEHTIAPRASHEFFFLTNAIITANQTYGKCDEDPNDKGAICGDGLAPCEVGVIRTGGQGINTGNCIPSIYKPGLNVCEIEGWCPVEYNVSPLKGQTPLLFGAANFTVLIKNSIHFKDFGPEYRRSNIMLHSGTNYLKTCHYNETTDPLCPIFKLEYMLKKAGENFSDVAYLGAAITVVIEWDCNLDLDFDEYCIPKYSFHRVDKTKTHKHPGWNFRHSYHHEFERRTLIKVYGIHFSIEIKTKGGKFSIIPTLINIGTGWALMEGSAFLVDLLLLHASKMKKLYREKKFKEVKGNDAYLPKDKNEIANDSKLGLKKIKDLTCVYLQDDSASEDSSKEDDKHEDDKK